MGLNWFGVKSAQSMYRQVIPLESEDAAKIRKTIDDLATIVRTLPATVATLEQEIARCEEALMDIDHWLEINDFPARAGGKLAKQIKQLRLKRRDLKDNLLILTPIRTFLAENQATFRQLDKLRGEIRKQVAYVSGTRSYTPRVLYELFGQEPPQTSCSAAMKKAKGQ